MPFPWALRANRHTSLRYALGWGCLACVAWLPVTSDLVPDLEAWRYLALCVTAAPGIAVLGARQPYVGAWNFVVLGLLAVMLLPLAESLVLGTDRRDSVRIIFMAATLAIGVLNYLPTRNAPAALLLGTGCAAEMVVLFSPEWLPPARWLAPCALALTPWTALLCSLRPRRYASELDRLWLDFRARFGLFWGQRLREQFNHAAQHAGWPVELRWSGLRRLEPWSPEIEAEMMDALKALQKRFIQESA